LVEAVALDGFDGGLVKIGEVLAGENLVFLAVAEDAALLQEDAAGDFRNDFVKMVSDEYHAGACLGESAEAVLEVLEHGDVEAVAGFVEDESLGIVDESPAD